MKRTASQLRVGVFGLFVVLIGCSSAPRSIEAPGPKVGVVLAQLPPLTTAPPANEPATSADAAAAYHRVEGTLPDAADNRAIDRRLADLGRRIGAESDPEHTADWYKDAIARYKALLADPHNGDAEDILYHLAEAYDALDDRKQTNVYLDRLIKEFPNSEYRVEAHFRRAELAFSAKDYDRAVENYAFVVDQGRTGAYWQNASYMLGWARFKQGEYERSLDSFFATIETILAENETPTPASKEMLDDTLRVVVIAVTYLDGADTLKQRFAKLHKPRWQYRVYERLADDLRGKQRFLDSVAALETFVKENPYDPHSVAFAQREIETLTQAEFPAEARKRKEAFIDQYPFGADYWVVNGNELRDRYAPTLKTYLLEIARLAHADGQREHQTATLLRASKYYEQFVSTFPLDPAVGEVLFLDGEALTDAHEPARALVAYQRVIHEHPADPHAQDAGYAAIVTLDTMLKTAKPTDAAMLTRTRIDAQIEYAMLFPNAPHAAEAQVNAANALFENHEYADADQLAQRLLDRRAQLSNAVALSATLIVAQSALEQQQFSSAETHYREALALTDSSSKETTSIRARLLASIYKQAEQDEARGDVDAAVKNYLRIATDDPNSDLAAKAHFDAVAAYEGAERWSDAADLLAEFRTRYPNSTLAPDLGTRLAGFYEKAGRRPAAAQEFERVASANTSAEVGRVALYHAAELYEDSDPARSIECFRRYVAAYPKPVDQALEAAHHLEVAYARAGDGNNLDYWLRKEVELVGPPRTDMNDRSRYLGASAQIQLAAAARRAFDAIPLSGDLKKSLARKQEALKQTVAAYEQAASYGVAEFATASTYQTADTYAALGRELLASPPPASLSDLEREQYQVLLEEQATPIEDLAISIHEINVQRSWKGLYDQWVGKSFEALRTLVPAKYARPEAWIGFVDTPQ